MQTKTFALALLASTTAITLPAPVYAQTAATKQVVVDIPAGDLVGALRKFARKARVEVVFSASDLRKLRTRGAKGTMSARDALERLIAGSGAQLVSDASGAFLVRAGGMRVSSASQIASSPSQASSSDAKEPAPRAASVAEEIVVTGTNIRGIAKPSSPLVVVSSESIRRSGYSDLGEVMRAVPQNFSGGQNPGVLPGASDGSVTSQNLTGGSGINLRGLGPDATLTLLNGSRLPYDGQYQATDISSIPVGAVQRVEILLDGASAIYGSDAVAGVANVILRRDFEGAEATVRFGEATEGGGAQRQAGVVAGAKWSAGGFLVSGEINRMAAIEANDRSYLAPLSNQNITVQPLSRQKKALFTGHQAVGRASEVSIDAFYSKRVMEQLGQGTATTFFEGNLESETWGISPRLSVQLPAQWNMRFDGFYGEDDATRTAQNYSVATGAATTLSITARNNVTRAIGAVLDGPLVELPGGLVRVSVGGGYRKNSYDQINVRTGAPILGGQRRSYYAFGEVDIPLVGQHLAVPGVWALRLNGAVRYEDYGSKDFGDVATPKIGLVWTVVEGLDLRGSWGKSFKTPTLEQQFQPASASLNPAASFGGTGVGNTVLAIFGGRPSLTPERAEVTTIGFTAAPSFAPGFRVELNWFDIRYRDRIVIPIANLAQALTIEAYAPFIVRSPDVATQNAIIAEAAQFLNFSGAAYNPANVIGIIDGRNINAAAQRAHGVDLTLDYATELAGGALTMNAYASWLHSRTRLTSLSDTIRSSGVVFYPPTFRARVGAAWAKSGLTLSSNLNRIGGVRDIFTAGAPEGSAMTTVDAVVSYEFALRPFQTIRLGISALNVFDARPPALRQRAPYLVNYDSSNYSPQGRFIGLTLSAGI